MKRLREVAKKSFGFVYMKRLLEIAKKKLSFLRYLEALSFRYTEKDEILQLQLHYLRCAAIDIQIVKKNKKQFQCSSYYISLF